MRDTITIGSIAGIVPTFIMTVYKGLLKLLGFNFISTWETAASILLNEKLINTPVGLIIGFIGQFSLGAIFGVVVAYMLKFTGKDYYLIKGVGAGALCWLSTVGFFMRFLGIQLQGRSDLFTNLLTVIDFVLMGTVSSLVVKKYADFKAKQVPQKIN